MKTLVIGLALAWHLEHAVRSLSAPRMADIGPHL